MYLPHFGLREFPFNLTPDIDFTYHATRFQQALNTLLLALDSGDGFIKITGAVGTGKTLLCRLLLRRLGDEGVGECVTAYVPNPKLHPHEMLRCLALELGLRVRRLRDEHELTGLIERKLLALAGEGKRVVLCIDEAQALPTETLETLRLLSNLETGKRKLIQIVLFGQEELNDLLAHAPLRSLASRIAFSASLSALSLSDFRCYLRHRLGVAGWSGPELFSASASHLLWRASGGVPRRANTIAHKALMLCYGAGRHQVDAATAWRAWRDERSWWGALSALLSMGLTSVLGTAHAGVRA
jgi:MSHA biogenesis protein MshM